MMAIVPAAADHVVVQRKRLFDDSDELFAADQKISQKVSNESINLPSPKNPKIQALVDEIINDSSLLKPHEMKIPCGRNQ